MLINPDKVKAKAKSKENENYAFRTYLKMHADPLKLDEQFRKLHEEFFSGYDCSQCRNCCKMYRGVIPQEDVEKAAGQFSMSRGEFIERFLEYDSGEMSYTTKHCPCDFLEENGACALGDSKPANCRKYPYTDQPDRMGSLLSIIESAEVCPVVYEILERLKEEYHFIKRKRVYPNDPCPCGSGLKYKKCCGRQ
jgi:Fe-S-cluster containining protein